MREDEAENYQTLLSWIEEAEDSDKLTKWESDFLASIKEQLETKKTLSERQIEILQKISSRVG